jgi:hypothetical protein
MKKIIIDQGKGKLKIRYQFLFTMNDFVFINFIAIFLFASSVFAQQSITSGGGEATGSGGSASFSVGQVFYQTTSDDGGTVSEGVQQPFEIFVITSIENIPDISVIVVAYPNPVTDNLMLVIKDLIDFSVETFHFRLSDINGRVLQSDKVAGHQTRIDMQNLPPAVYFLSVTDNRSELKTFRIVKN